MSSKSKRRSSNPSLMSLFGEEHKRIPSLGPEIVFWTRTKKPRVCAKRGFHTCLAAPCRCLHRPRYRFDWRPDNQDTPSRTQPERVWRTAFCPGERSPEAISVWTGEAPKSLQHGAIHQSLQILFIGFAFVKIKNSGSCTLVHSRCFL